MAGLDAYSEGVTDENGKDLSVTAGYIDRAILEAINDNLTELKNIIEALDYGVVFPMPK